MGRIMSLDYGTKRTGIAITDPLKIIVTGLDTVNTSVLPDFLKKYIATEQVEKIVLGLPMHRDGNYTYLKQDIDDLVLFIQKTFTGVAIDFFDEAFTSKDSKMIILQSGVKKSKRRDKGLVDKISAVLILQRYLGHI